MSKVSPNSSAQELKACAQKDENTHANEVGKIRKNAKFYFASASESSKAIESFAISSA